MSFVHIDYPAHDDCCDDENGYKMTCYRCGKCGRVFDGMVLVKYAPNETIDGEPVEEEPTP